MPALSRNNAHGRTDTTTSMAPPFSKPPASSSTLYEVRLNTSEIGFFDPTVSTLFCVETDSKYTTSTHLFAFTDQLKTVDAIHGDKPVRMVFQACLRLFQTSRHLIQSPSLLITATTIHTMSPPSSDRPTGLKSTSGIELLTFGTPKGHKASIILEELKAAYGSEYTFQSINIMETSKKSPGSPNGRIPVIVDHDRNGFSVFEGAAVLAYLTRNYDPDHKFSFQDPDDLSRCEQWVAWQHGGSGPMQGQANHFYRLQKERVPYPTQRYVGETECLYGVLDHQLSSRDYLVRASKGKYSIADIANFSWVNVAYFAGVDLSKFPNLEKWWKRIGEREAVKKGISVPSESQIVNATYQRRLKEEPEFKQREELKKLGDEAKEKYGYKYSSP